MTQISFDEVALRPIVQAVVAEVLERLADQRAKTNGRLAYSEPEAAALLGVKPYVLRDCRLRGELKAKKVGKGYRYFRDELIAFMESKK